MQFEGLSNRYYKGGFEPRMTRREASLILAVSPSAPAKKVKESHKRIMLLNHPDRGLWSVEVLLSLTQSSVHRWITLSCSKDQRSEGLLGFEQRLMFWSSV